MWESEVKNDKRKKDEEVAFSGSVFSADNEYGVYA